MNHSKHLKNCLLLVVLLPLLSSAQKGGGAAWQLLHRFPVSGNGFWDYLAIDPASGHLFVAHGTQVNVLDKTSGRQLAVIDSTLGVHGIAFDDARGKGYISDGRLNRVTVFDLKSFRVLKQIPVGANPDAIFYEDYSGKIITCNGRSQDLSIIDPATDQVLATTPVGGKPETAVSDGKGKIFVNIENKSEIALVDARDFSVKARWSIAPGESPTGLVLDRKHNRLFAGCDNKLLVVMDAANGKLVTTVPIGDGCDGVGFDESLHLVFASCGEGTLTVIRQLTADRYEVQANVPTQRGARTMAVDPVTHLVYLPTAAFGPPPAPSKENPRPRPSLLPDSFQVLVMGRK